MRKDRLLEDWEVKAMTRGHRHRRNAGLALLSLLLVGNCVPWYQTFNLCYPISKTHGVQGRFQDGGGLFTLWLEFAADELDDSSGSSLYRVSAKRYLALAPAAARLVPSSTLEFGIGIYGIVESGAHGSPVKHYFNTPGVFLPLEVIGVVVPGITFVYGAGLDQEHALFSTPVDMPLEPEDWKHFIGFCDRLPEESAAYLANSGAAYDGCTMEVFVGDIRATYQLDINQLEHYRYPHDFIRDEVLCKL